MQKHLLNLQVIVVYIIVNSFLKILKYDGG